MHHYHQITLLHSQHPVLSFPIVFGHLAFSRIASAGNKLICIQRPNNSSAPKIVKDKSSREDKVKIIWALYMFCGLNQPWQSSHQSPHFKVLFPVPSLGPPPVSLSMHHPFTNTHTSIHTEMHTQSFHTKTPNSAPLTSTPHFNFKMSLFCGAVTKSSHPSLVREKEIDWEEGKLTQRMSESERVWQRKMSPTLPCSFWTSRTVPTDWHRSHVQL